MSGGAFEYGCFQITQFAEGLQNKIDENETKDAYGDAPNVSSDVIALLQECQKTIDLAGKLAHEIEWFYSGDIGEETLVKRLDWYLRGGKEMNAINLNTVVRVKLTEKGKEIYNCSDNYKKLKDDCLETELWDIMSIFGIYFYNGCTLPFENNEIILV